jgi:hypothetical protein
MSKAFYTVKVRYKGELHEVTVEAASWMLAGPIAVREVGGGAIVDISDDGRSEDMITLD